MIHIFNLSNLLPFVIVGLLFFALVRAGKRPLWAEAYRRIRRNRLALIALGIIAVYGGIAFVDSIHWQETPTAEDRSILERALARIPAERTYSAPGATMTTGEPNPKPLKSRHLLGTDGTGRDVLVQTLRGCRTAMVLGVFASLISTPLALVLGLIAGYYGKWRDDLVQYGYTVLDSIPYILLVVSLMLVLGKGLDKLCIALGITSWVGLCRLARGETLKHREREYVRAAKALGLSDTRIMFRHILPNLLPIVIISVTLGLSGMMISETILSYLGIGVDPTKNGSWGNMIDAARQEMAREPLLWWSLASASVALFLLVWAFNVVGDALRDAIDPRLRSA